MNRLGALLLVLGALRPALADQPSLGEARTRWLRGNYEEARAIYEPLAKAGPDAEVAAIGLSRCWQSQGEYDKALGAVDAALRDHAGSAGLQARRADLLYLRGRWDEAEQTAEKALAAQKDHFLAHWVRAQVYRDRGELKKADAEFRWFVRTYTARSDANKDVKDPDELLLVGLAGCENARWNAVGDQFSFILNEVYGDALKADKAFWPAEYQAGALLLEKYNRGEALAAFDKALAINPSAAEALVGKGAAALQKYEIKDAERFAEQALKVNPNLPEALNLRADVHLATGALGKALADLEHSRQVNPRFEPTLGRISACYSLQKRADDFDKTVRDVEAHDAKPGVFYAVLGEQMEERRRFDEAETYYKKAAELWPMVPGPVNSLGLLYMRQGREKEARPLLEKGLEADGFNVRVGNSLKVLRHLDKYETLKTAHFELRFDPANDRLLARYMARYLEAVYTDLAAKFGSAPPGPILVEVFNNHEMFSGRTIGLPDLHTIGACTGRMVAMVSPRGKDLKEQGVRGPFNWGRVLRHEVVHVFNLEQTNFQVPHWFTEGLAVINEGYPRPQEWNQLLLERVPAGDLMTLANVDLGFIRPRSPLEWHMAYCQSQLYVEYMQEKYGPQTVSGMLAAYREGLDTAAAIRKVCGVDTDTFEKGYREHLAYVVRTLKGKPAEKKQSFLDLRRAYEKNPDDADAAARLAEQYLLRRRTADARKLADGVLAKQKNHPLASYVKARLLLAAGDDEAAKTLLEAAIRYDAPEPKVLKALGEIFFEAKDFARAAELFELGRRTEPAESQWLTDLVRTYTESGDKDRLIRVLQDLVATDADDLAHRTQLARLLLDAGRLADAERYARQGLEIDVLDADAQRALGDALLGQKKFGDAVEAYQTVLQIDERSDEARVKLAEAYLGKGDKDKARYEVARVLARDPANADAKRVQADLDK